MKGVFQTPLYFEHGRSPQVVKKLVSSLLFVGPRDYGRAAQLDPVVNHARLIAPLARNRLEIEKHVKVKFFLMLKIVRNRRIC